MTTCEAKLPAQSHKRNKKCRFALSGAYFGVNGRQLGTFLGIPRSPGTQRRARLVCFIQGISVSRPAHGCIHGRGYSTIELQNSAHLSPSSIGGGGSSGLPSGALAASHQDLFFRSASWQLLAYRAGFGALVSSYKNTSAKKQVHRQCSHSYID